MTALSEEHMRQIVREELTGVKADVGTLKTDVADLKQNVTALTTDVNTLKSDMADVKADVKLILGIAEKIAGGLEKEEHERTTADAQLERRVAVLEGVAGIASST